MTTIQEHIIISFLYLHQSINLFGWTSVFLLMIDVQNVGKLVLNSWEIRL